MKKKFTLLLPLLLAVLLAGFISRPVQAQCPTAFAISSTPVSCKGGSDGTVTATYTAPAAPSSFLLWRFSGAFTPLASATQVVSNGGFTVTFTGLPALPPGGVYTVSADFTAQGCLSGPQFTSFVVVAEPAAALSLNITSQTNVTGCFGDATGSINVAATGGNGGNQYSINGSPFSATSSFTGLAAGTYGIQVKDSKNCIDNKVVVITQPTQITATTTNTNPSCNGQTDGSITVNASGGTPSYTYSLNGGAFQALNTFSGLADGTYTIQVKDANGCALPSTLSVTLTQPPVLSISLTSKTDIANCFGDATGQVVVSVSGGNPTYSYSANGGAYQAGVGNSFTFTGLTAGTYTITVKDSKGCTTTLAAPVTLTQPPQLTLTLASQTNILCNGGNNGAIAVTAAGGTPSYEYSVNGSAFAPGTASQSFATLIAGTYDIRVRDTKGCITTLPTVAITQPPVLSISLTSSQNISCNGGTDGNLVTVTTGGTLPYQYSVNGGAYTSGTGVFASLTAGAYTVIVKDANGCTAALPTVTLTEPTALTLAFVTKTDIANCFGDATGSISVTAGGGTPAYEYSVNGGAFAPGTASQTFSSLTAGTYDIRVRDSKGCITTLPTVTLTQPPLLVPVFVSSQNISCNAGTNGQITFSVSGGTSGYDYQVNGGAFSPVSSNPLTLNNLTAGTYTITVRDAKGCTKSLPAVTLTQPAVLAISLTSQTNVLCNGQNTGQIVVAVTGGTLNYDFSVNGGAFVAGTASQTYSSLTAGTYNITVRDANGCTAILPTVTLTQPPVLALSLNAKTDVANCFGDATGSITVTGSGGNPGYQYSVNGGAFSAGTASQTFPNLTAGTYSIIIKDANGCTVTLPTVTITQPAPVTLVLVSQTNPDCNGASTGSISVTTGGGIPGYDYSVNGGAFAAGTASQTFNSLTAGTYTIRVRDSKGCITTLPTVTLTQPPALVLTFAGSQNISCNAGSDGQITLNITGGTPAYSYQVNGGALSVVSTNPLVISGLAAGTYNIIVKDANGCTQTLPTLTLTQPPALVISLTSQTNVSCNGLSDGQIVTAVSGGTSPYQYAVNGGAFAAGTGTFSSLAAGTYSIVVKDAKGCTATLPTVSITQPAALSFTLTSQTNVGCNGQSTGQIVTAVSGGTLPYQYSVNGGAFAAGTGTFSNLAAGTYNIIVKDASGCTSTLPTIALTQPAALSFTLTSQTNVLCNGQSTGQVITAISGGTSPYQYAVNGGAFAAGTGTFSNLTAGTYNITVKDANGCTQSLPAITITQPAALSFTLTSQTNVGCNGQSTGQIVTAVSGGTSPYQYSVNGGAFAAGTGTFSNLAAGTYDLTIKDVNSCTVTLPTITLTQPAALSFTLTSQTNITGCAGDATGQIVTAVSGGASPYQYSVNGGAFATGSGTFASLTAGTYNIIVKDANGCTVTLPTVTLTEPPALAISLVTSQNISCNGGTDGQITFSVSGGTAGYDYQVNGGAFLPVGSNPLTLSNLVAGTYTITVRDAKGCTKSLPAVTLTQPAVLAISLTSQTNVLCNGQNTGQVVTAVSGGTSPYQFSVNGGAFSAGSSTFSSLTAGTYNIVVKDASGCTAALPTVTLTQPTAINFALTSSQNISCNGATDGQIVTAVSGGVSPYQYSVNSGAFASGTGTFSNLAAGTYNIVVKDANGCIQSLPAITITQPAALSFTLTSQTNVGCNGQSTGQIVTAVSGGTSPYQYAVNGGAFAAGTGTFSNLTAGTYNIIVKDASGCTTALPAVTLTQPTVLGIALTSQTNVSCNSGNNGQLTVAVTGGTSGYDFSVNGGAFAAGTASQTFSNLTAGTYTITVRDANGCTQALSPVTLTQPTALSFTLTSQTNASCNGATDGQVITALSGGVSPYQYSVNGGAFAAGTGTFSGLTAGTYNIIAKDANGCLTSLPAVTLTQPTAISFTLTSSQNISCNGATDGQIVTTVSGGTSPYQYAVNGGAFAAGTGTFTNLAANSYSIVVKDASGCTVTLPTVTLTQPAALSFTLTSSQNISCNGATDGQIVTAISGGVSPYQYSVNGGAFAAGTGTFAGLTAGTYSIVVKDANGCTQSLPAITITEPAVLAISLLSQNNITGCAGNNNGNITVTVTGGTSGYQYSINGSAFAAGTATQVFSSLTAGTYSIVVKDAKGCLQTLAPVTLTQPVAIALTLNAQTNVTCGGGTDGQFSVTASGGTAPYQYSLNGGSFTSGTATQVFSNLAANTYNVTVKDANGCTQSLAAVVISQPATLVLTVSSQTNPKCNAGTDGQITASVTGGTSPYQFSINGGAFQAGNTFTGLTAGTYSLAVQDAKNCTTTLPNVILSQPAVLSVAVSSQTDINICAGITSGTLNVTATGGTAAYQFSLNGGAFQTSGTFSGLSAGAYTVQVKDANGCLNSVNATILVIPSSLTATLNATNVSCSGGTDGQLSVTGVSGGSGSYDYSLNGGAFQSSAVFAGLAAGSYSVVIRDKNTPACTLTLSANLAQPAVLAISLTSQTDITGCFGNSNGQVVVAVSGGTSPYQYSLNGGAFASGTGTFAGLIAGTYNLTVQDAKGCTAVLPTITLSQPAKVTANLSSKTDVDGCNGGTNGSITATVSGGTSPYQFSLNGGAFQATGTFSSLAAGTYQVIARDANNCPDTLKNIVISQPAPVTLALASKTDLTCDPLSKGSFSVTVSGGTPGYQFSLDGGAFATGSGTYTNLIAGTYNLTVIDSKGCSQTLSNIVINSPGAITPTGSSTNPTACGATNGSITITSVAGGSGSYVYSLDGTSFQLGATFSGLSNGGYTVYIRDVVKTCTVTATFTLTSPGGIVAAVTPTNATCGGSNGQIVVSGVSGGSGSGYQYSLDGVTYQASGTFIGLAAGTYKVRIKDNATCSTSIDVVITAPAGLQASVSGTNLTDCSSANGSITVSGLSGGSGSYEFSLDGTTFQAGTTFTGLNAGTFTVTIRDAANPTCLITRTQTLTAPNAISATLASQNVSCNAGTDGQLTVNNPTGGSGSYEFSKDGTTFQASNIFSGLTAAAYTITVRDKNNPTCKITLSATLTAPAAINATVTGSVNPGCVSNNGSISVLVSGGTAPYQYAVNGSAFSAGTASQTFSSLAAGSYVIQVKDSKGCTLTLPSVTLAAPTGVTATVTSADETTCNGNDGKVTVSGVTGTAPFSYFINGNLNPAGATNPNFTALAPGSYTIKITDANGCSFTQPVTIARNCPCNITATATIVPVVCAGINNGAAFIVNVQGGSGSYEYNLDGGTYQTTANFTSLAAGNYTIGIRDQNNITCTASFPVTVVAQFQVSAVIIVNQPKTCNDKGSIEFTNVNGGTAPYQFSTNGTTFSTTTLYTGLNPGSYPATIRDNNSCTLAVNISITGVTAISATVAAVNVSCFGGNDGSLKVSNAAGGSGTYIYSIDGTNFAGATTFNNLKAGSYTVYVKDQAGNCVSTFPATLTQPAKIITTSTATQPTACAAKDGQLTLATTAGNIAPLTYSLNGGAFQAGSSFTGLGAGLYTVITKNGNGCTDTLKVTLSAPNGITATPGIVTQVSCNGSKDGSIQLTNVSGGSGTFEYAIDGVTFQTSALFSGLTGGIYTLTVRDKGISNPCLSTYSIALPQPAALTAAITGTNPSSCTATDGSLSIANISGGTAPYQVSLDSLTGYQTALIFSNLGNKNYKVYVKDSKGCVSVFPKTLINTGGVTAGTPVLKQPVCRGDKNGQLQMQNVAGGTAPYQYSLDNVNYQNTGNFSGLGAGTYAVYVKDASGCVYPFSYVLPEPAGIDFTVAILANADCGAKTGKVEVRNISGGTAPYLYSLNGVKFQASAIFDTLTAGDYTLYVRDNSASTCPNSKPFTVLGTPPVTYKIDSVKIGCTGGNAGKIVVYQIKGGIKPYKVSLDGGNTVSFVTADSIAFNNLAPGAYQFVLDFGNGCKTPVRTINISAGTVPFSVSTTPATCGSNTGKATVQIANPQNYFYSIDSVNYVQSTVFDRLKPGRYIMFVRQSQTDPCVNKFPFVVGGPDSLRFDAKRTDCDKILLTSIRGGVQPYKISVDGGTTFVSDNLFSNTFTTLSLPFNKTYTVVVQDKNNCLSAPIRLNVFNNLKAVITTEQTLNTQSTGSVAVTDIRGGLAPYEVSIDGGKTYGVVKDKSIPIDTLYRNLPAGTYPVFIRDAAGCVKMYVDVVVKERDFLIPNTFTPNGDDVNDTFVLLFKDSYLPPDNTRITIYNRWGKQVYQNSNYKNDWTGGSNVDGTYFYEITVPGIGNFNGYIMIWRGEGGDK